MTTVLKLYTNLSNKYFVVFRDHTLGGQDELLTTYKAFENFFFFVNTLIVDRCEEFYSQLKDDPNIGKIISFLTGSCQEGSLIDLTNIKFVINPYPKSELSEELGDNTEYSFPTILGTILNFYKNQGCPYGVKCERVNPYHKKLFHPEGTGGKEGRPKQLFHPEGTGGKEGRPEQLFHPEGTGGKEGRPRGKEGRSNPYKKKGGSRKLRNSHRKRKTKKSSKLKKSRKKCAKKNTLKKAEKV